MIGIEICCSTFKNGTCAVSRYKLTTEPELSQGTQVLLGAAAGIRVYNIYLSVKKAGAVCKKCGGPINFLVHVNKCDIFNNVKISYYLIFVTISIGLSNSVTFPARLFNMAFFAGLLNIAFLNKSLEV